MRLQCTFRHHVTIRSHTLYSGTYAIILFFLICTAFNSTEFSHYSTAVKRFIIMILDFPKECYISPVFSATDVKMLRLKMSMHEIICLMVCGGG